MLTRILGRIAANSHMNELFTNYLTQHANVDNWHFLLAAHEYSLLTDKNARIVKANEIKQKFKLEKDKEESEETAKRLKVDLEESLVASIVNGVNDGSENLFSHLFSLSTLLDHNARDFFTSNLYKEGIVNPLGTSVPSLPQDADGPGVVRNKHTRERSFSAPPTSTGSHQDDDIPPEESNRTKSGTQRKTAQFINVQTRPSENDDDTADGRAHKKTQSLYGYINDEDDKGKATIKKSAVFRRKSAKIAGKKSVHSFDVPTHRNEPKKGEEESDDDSDEMYGISFENLLQKLTESEMCDMFPIEVLHTYRSFCTPIELMEGIIARCQNTDDSDVQMRCINILRFWIDRHWSDFSLNKDELVQALNSFKSGSRALDLKTSANASNQTENYSSPDSLAQNVDQLKDIIAKKSSSPYSRSSLVLLAIMSKAPAPIIPPPSEPLTLLAIDSLELARQLTLIDEQIFHAIQPNELLGQVWTKEGAETKAPNIWALTNRFNHISYWVQTELVTCISLRKRSRILAKFIEVSQHLRDMNNFNGLFEVISALNASPVYRMKKTWDSLSERSLEYFQETSSLLDTMDKMKKVVRDGQFPAIPYIGMYLTDLIYIETGNEDTTPEGLINFRKRQVISKTIREIQKYQEHPYCFHHILSIQNWIKKQPSIQDDNLLFEFSSYLEPRTGTAATEIPPELEAFLDRHGKQKSREKDKQAGKAAMKKKQGRSRGFGDRMTKLFSTSNIHAAADKRAAVGTASPPKKPPSEDKPKAPSCPEDPEPSHGFRDDSLDAYPINSSNLPTSSSTSTSPTKLFKSADISNEVDRINKMHQSQAKAANNLFNTFLTEINDLSESVESMVTKLQNLSAKISEMKTEAQSARSQFLGELEDHRRSTLQQTISVRQELENAPKGEFVPRAVFVAEVQKLQAIIDNLQRSQNSQSTDQKSGEPATVEKPAKSRSTSRPAKVPRLMQQPLITEIPSSDKHIEEAKETPRKGKSKSQKKTQRVSPMEKALPPPDAELDCMPPIPDIPGSTKQLKERPKDRGSKDSKDREREHNNTRGTRERRDSRGSSNKNGPEKEIPSEIKQKKPVHQIPALKRSRSASPPRAQESAVGKPPPSILLVRKLGAKAPLQEDIPLPHHHSEPELLSLPRTVATSPTSKQDKSE